ncbi:MAG TPA: PDZ domain-containing protein [Candidatus Magasanikbacteria bacterium]|nr:PDZ domain-containing protein [Candidatus Magasanikbacteria bacterium]
MSHPPHLPNPSCSISLHQLWQRLGLIFLSIFFGLIGGLTGAAMTVGWIWPDLGGGNYWLVSQVDRSSQKVEMEEFIKKETSQKIMSVYENSQKSGEVSFLNSQSKLGEAALVGSDGWLAMYLSDEKKSNNFITWTAVNNEGRTYKIEKLLYDKLTKIVYFKIRGLTKSGETEIKNEQFKVIGFSENEKLGEQVFVYQNNSWRYNFLADEYSLTVKPHLDSVPMKVRTLENKNAPAGSLVLNNQGRFLGFLNENNEVIGSVYVNRVLPGVLNKQQIIYPTFSIEGWYSSEQILITDGGVVKGFLVTGVLKNDSKLQKGDIILEINGQIVENENLWYNLRGEQARLKVLRRGKVLDLEAQIKENIFK